VQKRLIEHKMIDPPTIRSTTRTILDVRDLTVAYRHGKEWLQAVRNVSLHIDAGETYGLVGESGSGKTTLVLAVLRYLGSKGSIISGDIHLGDQSMRALDDQDLRQVWGKQVALVPQNPQSSLNPSLRVGEQLAEIFRYQNKLSEPDARQQTLEWFQKVRLPDPERVAASYPHQISGGMQQRVLIAMALSPSPSLLVLDEPTTNLDVTTQAVILELIDELIREQDMAVLYVTHNLGVISRYCDRVGVIYASELVEEAAPKELFSKPLHPYTQGLLDSIPQLGETKHRIQLIPIPGQIPPIGQGPSGCIFRTRCPIAIDICTERPALFPAGEIRLSRCHRWQEIALDDIGIQQALPSVEHQPSGMPEGRSQTLELENVSISFPIQRSLNEFLRGKPRKAVQAVNEVDLVISPGTTLGLVGESGSGKTTLVRSIMGLQPISAGAIKLHQVSIPDKLSRRDLETLRQLQIVFQNPQEALNPHLTIGETLRRPFIRLLGLPRSEADARVIDLLEAVHLTAAYAKRYPGELSGGEIQRVAFARGIASKPDLLILDEPISSLDVSVQAAILNLVNEIQSEFQNSLLFISHNLAVIGYLADQIAVIYVGTLMEIAGQSDLFQPPHHPYTEALISAIPQIEAQISNLPIHLDGEMPDPVNIPAGCPFHTRCPRFIGEICANTTPPWQIDPRTKKRIFCHVPLEDLLSSQTQSTSRGTSLE
jgi:peptide/nickel transport system ATP-binding protein